MRLFKTVLFFSALVFILGSCSKKEETKPQTDHPTEDKDTDQKKEEKESFDGVFYITQAEKTPFITIDMDDEMTEPSVTTLSVTIKDNKTAPKDISVYLKDLKSKVAEYNQKNDTDFLLLPPKVYEISPSSVTIEKGKSVSNETTIRIFPSELDEGGYVLPVSISSDKYNTDQNLSTVYFVINTPEKAAPTKVLSLGSDWEDIIANGPDGVLYQRDSDGSLWIYSPNEDGVFLQTEKTKQEGFGACAVRILNINDSVEFALNGNDCGHGLWRFDIDPNSYQLLASPTENPSDPFPTNFGFFYGDNGDGGWPDLWVMGVGDFVFFINKSTGELKRWSISRFLNKNPNGADFPGASGTWNKLNMIQNNTNALSLRGFNVYKQVLALEEGLLAVKSDGSLWYYSISTAGEVGTPQKIGTGWDKYDKILTTAKDVLALDENGDLYRYKNIDPNKTYDL